jgi:hypothetical protein
MAQHEEAARDGTGQVGNRLGHRAMVPADTRQGVAAIRVLRLYRKAIYCGA